MPPTPGSPTTTRAKRSIEADGRRQISLRVADPAWVRALVLGSAGQVEVLSPEWLAESIRDEARAALARYRAAVDSGGVIDVVAWAVAGRSGAGRRSDSARYEIRWKLRRLRTDLAELESSIGTAARRSRPISSAGGIELSIGAIRRVRPDAA